MKVVKGIEINEVQEQYIRYFGEVHKSGRSLITASKFIEEFNLTGETEQRILWRELNPLLPLGVIEKSGATTVITTGEVLNVIALIDAPPPKRNYFKEWTENWFNSPWLSAITVIGIGLPLIWSWCEIIIKLTQWITSTEH